MPQITKQFSEKLNKSLDDIGAPFGIRERATILSKLLHIPKQQAWAVLDGHLFPDNNLLEAINSELGVDMSLFAKNR